MRRDDVQVSAPAWSTFGAIPIADTLAEMPDDGGLVGAARLAHGFLEEHPRLARSSFGKAASLLVRAAVHLEKAGTADALPDHSKAMLSRAVEQVQTFLETHPRVSESPFGASVAELAQGVARAIKADDSGAGTQLIDWLMEAARKADAYLEEFPKLADMPLGQVVNQMIDGVKAKADGNPLDADLQTLAKRVGYFLQSHPRLANSEFGQLVSPLVRGIAAIDVSTRPEAEPLASGTDTPETEITIAVDVDGAAGEMRQAA